MKLDVYVIVYQSIVDSR